MSIEKPNIPIVRHFDEEDLITLSGRDGEILPDQEEKAKEVAKAIYFEMLKNNQKSVFFITSEKKRTSQTADLITKELIKIDSTIKINKSVERDIEAIREGEYIIPDEYKPGDYFVGLELASKAFFAEVYKSMGNLSVNNFLYKYGDPVLLKNGTYKYPELCKYFRKPGENYKELLLRIYKIIVTTHNKLHKFQKNTKVVVITHGQPAQIFKDLNIIGDKIKNEHLNFKKGELPDLCLAEYNKRDISTRVTGQTDLISMDNLSNPELISKLEEEIDYLENIN